MDTKSYILRSYTASGLKCPLTFRALRLTPTSCKRTRYEMYLRAITNVDGSEAWFATLHLTVARSSPSTYFRHITPLMINCGAIISGAMKVMWIIMECHDGCMTLMICVNLQAPPARVPYLREHLPRHGSTHSNGTEVKELDHLSRLCLTVTRISWCAL